MTIVSTTGKEARSASAIAGSRTSRACADTMPGMNAAKRKDLTPAEAATIAGVDRWTIWHWYQIGRLPGAWKTAGGHLRIPLEVLAAALKERH